MLGECGPGREASTFDFDNSKMLWGWTIGVGAEYALSLSLSLKVEYQHFDFGYMSSDCAGEDRFQLRAVGYMYVKAVREL